MAKYILSAIAGFFSAVIILVIVLAQPSRRDLWQPLIFGRYSDLVYVYGDRLPESDLSAIRQRWGARKPEDPEIALLVEKSFETLPALVLTDGSKRFDIGRDSVEHVCVDGIYKPNWEDQEPEVTFFLTLNDEASQRLVRFFEQSVGDKRASDAIYFIADGQIIQYGFATRFSVMDLKQDIENNEDGLFYVQFVGTHLRYAREFAFKLTDWRGLKPCNPDYYDHDLFLQTFGN